MQRKPLFERHLKKCMATLEDALSKFELDGLVLTAGMDRFYFQDDQDIPFRPSHHFTHYCPAEGKGHAVILVPGKKPQLFHYCPDDFWYDHLALEATYWTDSFEVQAFTSQDKLWQALSGFKHYAYLGPDEKTARKNGFEPAPKALEHYLNWFRAYKSDYEVYCLDKATEIAARGHSAARACFLEGGSELDIHLAYLAATRMTEVELPYTGIIGLDEKSAILHYAQKRDDVHNGKVMLIDSGAKYCGYGSDITRTHTSADAPQVFQSMLAAMNREQLLLCDAIKPGLNFGDLVHASHLAVARVLLEHDVLRGLDEEAVVEKGLSAVFYPHGLGHMLGILVHDIGSKQIDIDGNCWEKDKRDPTLTRMRDIETGFVFTIEPGLYFIGMLLEPQREAESSRHFNWPLIERMLPLGGIRVEDNIHIANDGVRNLTRPYLPQ